MTSYISICLFSMVFISIFSNCRCRLLSETDDFELFKSYEVHVINNISVDGDQQQLFLQCKSGDDDLGGHTLSKGDDIHWHFKVNFWGSTLFDCKMNWGSKRQEFTVFTVGRMTINCEKTGECFWMVTEERFYFSCDRQNYMLQYVWNLVIRIKRFMTNRPVVEYLARDSGRLRLNL